MEKNRIKRKVLKKLKSEYDQIGNPRHGFIKVMKDDKYGFVDEQGRLLIPPTYDWSSSFVKLKLYGKEYVGAYVIAGDYQTIITPENRKIIRPIENGRLYYIINGKLWLKTEQGFNLISRRGKKLLATDYDVIVEDHLQQPKNIFLVKKGKFFGGVHISYNNQEKIVVPFEFDELSFWWVPIMGTFLEGERQGKRGLYSLKGKLLVSCRYTNFECSMHFRKGFVVAMNKKETALYDGKQAIPICSDPYYTNSTYAFYYRGHSYYSAFTTTEELLLDQNAKAIIRLDKDKHISYFHFLMDQQRENFRFKSLGELITYCKANPRKRIGRKDLVIYAYFFLEEELHKYARMYDLKFTRFRFLDWKKERSSCWGTCDPLRREISLNMELVFTSEAFVKQVVLHELCHFVHRNHRKSFYGMLNNLYGTDVRKEPVYGLETRWFETVDAKAVVRAHLSQLYDRAEQGILRKLPENNFTTTVQILQQPIKQNEAHLNDRIAAMTVKLEDKPLS